MVNLSFNLQDKVFVVTGGSRGIGLEIANLLLGQQAQVIICGRKQEGLDAARQELNAGNRLKTMIGISPSCCRLARCRPWAKRSGTKYTLIPFVPNCQMIVLIFSSALKGSAIITISGLFFNE